MQFCLSTHWLGPGVFLGPIQEIGGGGMVLIFFTFPSPSSKITESGPLLIALSQMTLTPFKFQTWFEIPI